MSSNVEIVLDGFGEPVYVPVQTMAAVVNANNLVAATGARDVRATTQQVATVAAGPHATVVKQGASVVQA